MPVASRATPNAAHPERVGQILDERAREVERDRLAGREEVGDLDVEQEEQHDRASRLEQRTGPRQPRARLIGRLPATTPPPASRPRDEVRVQVPVPESAAVRVAGTRAPAD